MEGLGLGWGGIDGRFGMRGREELMKNLGWGGRNWWRD